MYIQTGNQEDSLIKELFNYDSKSTLDKDLYTYIFFQNENKNKGYVIYCDYTGYSVSMHIHLPKCLTRQVIRKMFEYPFKELNVVNLFIEFRSSNGAVRKIANGLGFVYHTSIDNYYGLMEDKIIMVANRNNIQKWLE